MFITLDAFEILEDNIVDLQFLEWYDKNRNQTKQLVKLGYFLLKDGLHNYMCAEEKNNSVNAMFEETVQQMKESLSKLIQQEYNTKTALAFIETEQRLEKKYMEKKRQVDQIRRDFFKIAKTSIIETPVIS